MRNKTVKVRDICFLWGPLTFHLKVIHSRYNWWNKGNITRSFSIKFLSPLLCLCVSIAVHSGFLDSEPLREADEDYVSEVNLNNSIMTEEEREEIHQELAKVRPHMPGLKLKKNNEGCYNKDSNRMNVFVLFVSSWKRRSARWSRFWPLKRSSKRTSDRNWASLLWASSKTTSAEAGTTCRRPQREFEHIISLKERE